MYLRKFSFSEKKSGWNVENAQFDRLTLLVGASGVGKTKILEAIGSLAFMANGESFNGITWKAEIEHLNVVYTWEGETEIVDDRFDNRQMPIPSLQAENNQKEEFTFISEKLYKNDVLISKRDEQGIYLNDQPTIKLSKTQSLLHILKEEEKIQEFSIIFNKVNFFNAQFYPINTLSINPPTDLSDIILSNQSLSVKLYHVYEYFPEKFAEIKKEFIEIFNFVEDVKYALPEALINAQYNPVPDMRVLQLKEVSSDRWICVWDFSSGMKRALGIIAVVHLYPERSLFLLDEFENSFGINCIESVTDIVLDHAHNEQFILSSHHPYIINNIPFKYWKLVTRNGNTVSVRNVDDIISTRSKHEAFIQLINSPLYTEGATG